MERMKSLVVLVRIPLDDSVPRSIATNRPVGPALEFAAEVRQHLERADLLAPPG